MIKKTVDGKVVVYRISKDAVKNGVLEIDGADKINEYAAFPHPLQAFPKIERLTISGRCREIRRGAFMENKSLKYVTLKEGVEYLHDWAFFGCENLVSVKIPSSVKRIGIRTFGKCPHLKSVTISNRTAYDPTSFPENVKVCTKEQLAFKFK